MTELDEYRQALNILQYVKRERARLRDLEDPARATIEDVLRDSEVGTIAGRPAVKWATQSRTVLSQKILRTKFPDVAALCMETVEVRRFEVLDDDESV